MAGLKDIKRRIKSVKNTKKITYAMKLVSAAKLKKAQDAVKASREYTDALGQLLSELLAALSTQPDLEHPLTETRPEVKKIRIVVVGGSRGLCGAFNTNINKRVESARRELAAKNPGASIDAVIFGKKPFEYHRNRKIPFSKHYIGLSEDANEWPIEEVCLKLESDFISGEIDEAYILYTQFRSAMSQSVLLEKLLPMDAGLSESGGAELSTGLTLFEPSAEAVFEAILPRILRTKILQAGLDSKASEHGSRMVAMDSATKNAGELVHKLSLKHNKLRQGAITSELLDIIGGAEALN
ncbi:MAG: ATP synthase F1 subunit gamma [Bdellovibrionales bacterium]|nr:ATP synthase F1 subunit gamma [Bdellovibrionales bacterium]